MASSQYHSWIKWLALAFCILGIIVRFYHLDGKVYWIDETYTSLRISGYGEQALIQQVYTGNVISVADLQRYQQPSGDRTIADTLNSLKESPQHPPLYFLLARFWVKAWGYSIAHIRAFSAFLSLITLPAAYWFCREAFHGKITAWVAIALMAISPFHVLYAQEARQYSLWIGLILLSSAALLRAVSLERKQQHQNSQDEDYSEQKWTSKRASVLFNNSRLVWGLYGCLTALSLYTFLLTGLVILAHIAYVICCSWRGRSPQIMKRLWLGLSGALGIALIAFSPWLWVMVDHANRVTSTASWASQRFSLDWLLLRWLLYPINLFFDLNLGDRYLTSPILLVMILFAGLLGYSCYRIWGDRHDQHHYFIICLILVPALVLILPDIILGGQRSGTARYMIPCYLGIQLAVSYTVSWGIQFSKTQKGRSLWMASFIVLLLGGILSCLVSSQAYFWWNKSPDKHLYNLEIAETLNSAHQPLLISDDSTVLSDCFACRMLSLSYELKPDIQLQLVRQPMIPAIPTSGVQDVFVLSDDQAWVRQIQRKNDDKASLIFEKDNFGFWQLFLNTTQRS
jgi:uncharacterized membrane protein